MPLVRSAGSEGSIRVVRVTRRGSEAGWSALGNAISKLRPDGFVAIDTEFSGFGNDSKLSDPDLAIRYEAIRALVDTGAVLSLGIAVFNPRENANSDDTDDTNVDANLATTADAAAIAEPDDEAASSQYDVSAFDFCMSCDTPWTVSSSSGQFLVAHGFDFNRLFSAGIPYTRASTDKADRKTEAEGIAKRQAKGAVVVAGSTGGAASTGVSMGAFSWGPMPRGLLWRIGRAGVPLVVHNGLLDIAFLYAAFHGPLPETLNGFVGGVLDAMPAGIYDTKHMAGGVGGVRTTFLAYVYAQAVQSGKVRVVSGAGLPRAEIASPEDVYGDAGVGGASMETVSGDTGVRDFCVLYAMRGHCPKGTSCALGHDVFAVVAHEVSGKCVPTDIKEGRKLYTEAQKGVKKRGWLRERRDSDAEAEAGSVPSCEAVQADNDGSEKKRIKLSKKQKRRMRQAEGSGVAASDGEGDSKSKEHCAGFDAYMTGLCYGWLRRKQGASGERNMVSLAKKARPLVLCRSDFDEVNHAVIREGGREAAVQTAIEGQAH
jgi:target of EGR1 protein 1